MTQITPIKRAAQLLQEADGLLITAGAGMGVDSGLPDFRGNNGFWNAYPALGKMGFEFSTIANGQYFSEYAALCWGFYGHRLKLYRETVPHAGFAILQELAATMPHGAFVYTSNVDGQFQKAGFAADRIHECHGSIHHLQCAADCGTDIWSADELDPVVDETRCLLTSRMPRCPACGEVARPNILMFNDGYWRSERSDQQAIRLQNWLSQVTRLLVIELGAGLALPAVRRFGEARQAPLIRINPRDAAVKSLNQVSLPMGAQAGLQAILSQMPR